MQSPILNTSHHLDVKWQLKAIGCKQMKLKQVTESKIVMSLRYHYLKCRGFVSYEDYETDAHLLGKFEAYYMMRRFAEQNDYKFSYVGSVIMLKSEHYSINWIHRISGFSTCSVDSAAINGPLIAFVPTFLELCTKIAEHQKHIMTKSSPKLT